MKAAGANRILEGLLFAHAALLPISIATGQIWAYLLAFVAIIAWCAGKLKSVGQTPLFRVLVLFVAAVLFSVAVGVRPDLAVHKLDRLLLLAVPLILPLFGEPKSSGLGRRLILAFLAGCTVKAAYDCVRIPFEHVCNIRAYETAVAAGSVAPHAVSPSLYDLGNMRDPQFYAVAICLATALWLARAPGYRRSFLFCTLLTTGLATLMHFKRGAWLALGASLLVLGLMSRQRRIVLFLLAVALLATFIPTVRVRVGQLRQEFQLRTGGRFALWTRVAPELYREYPLGMGWRSVEHEDLLDHGAPVQKKLNHLHDNLLHVRLETGWFGLGAWLLWMGTAFAYLLRAWRLAERDRSDWRGPALGLFAGFLALHLNGLVEYNFGDGEIFMLMNLVMGLGVAGWMRMNPTSRPAHQLL